MGGVGAVGGLAFGVLLAVAGSEALSRGVRALFAGAVGLTAFFTVLAAAVPEFAFASRAAAMNLPGAALGVVVGSLTANAFVAAIIAARGAGEPARGARTFAVASALAGVALIAAAFDGRITQVEGELMLAAAVVAGFFAFRRDVAVDEPVAAQRPALGAGWLALGVVLAGAGTWLALEAVRGLSLHRADRDLVSGLTALGAGAALPEIVAAWFATRAGGDGRAFVKVVQGVSLTLFGALGLAAVVRPLTISETFLGAPAVAVGLSALVLMAFALTRARAPRGAVVLGLIIYGGFLVAFARSAG
jgi:cation:H+ antiporter